MRETNQEISQRVSKSLIGKYGEKGGMKMPRKIKFRAWHKEKRIMVYDNEDETYGYWDGCCNSNVGMVNTILNSKWYEEYIFMQYTGLHDKNGKEIYEGDILKFSEVDTAIVEWNEKYSYFMVKPIQDYYFDSDVLGHALEYNDNVEIIGNVYENSDLLKGADNID